jgi:hypothetical protein
MPAEEVVPTPEVDPDIAPPSKPRRPRQQRAGASGPVIDPDKADRIRVDDMKVPDLDGDEDESDEPEKVPVTVLSEDERLDFSSLLTVGRRSKKLMIADHEVTIETLTVSDELRIGLYTKPHMGSQGFSHAYRIGVLASGIREVNGQPLFRSLKQLDKQEHFDKAVTIVEQYYPIVVDRLYTEIMNLDREFAELAIKAGKLSG